MVEGAVPPLIEGADRWAVFIDVDGTLVAIADTPSAVRIEAPLKALLTRLEGTFGGALALISGRRVADIDGLFRPLRLAVAGVHGAERRDAHGTMHSLAPTALLRDLLPPIEAFATTHRGILVEDKGASLAVHYRLAPDAEDGLRRLVATLIDGREEIEAVDGKMLVELRPRGVDKGRAIRTFMTEAPFAGRRPLFIGDDVTDEDGFAAVNAMGGMTVRVGDGSHTAARFRLADVVAVLDWLGRVADALEGEREGRA